MVCFKMWTSIYIILLVVCLFNLFFFLLYSSVDFLFHYFIIFTHNFLAKSKKFSYLRFGLLFVELSVSVLEWVFVCISLYITLGLNSFLFIQIYRYIVVYLYNIYMHFNDCNQLKSWAFEKKYHFGFVIL